MNLLNIYLGIDIKKMTQKAREMNIDFVSPAKTKSKFTMSSMVVWTFVEQIAPSRPPFAHPLIIGVLE